MNTPIAAIKYNSGKCFCLSRRQCVILIALLELIGSMCSIGGYWLAYYKYPSWKKFITIPPEFQDDTLIRGFLNTLTILAVCRFFISIVLLDGVLYVKLGQIRFWLTSLLTYKVVAAVLVIGMQLAGCKAPKANAVIFITVFMGLIEMLFVYAYVEEEVMRRNSSDLLTKPIRRIGKSKRLKKSLKRSKTVTTLIDYENEIVNIEPEFNDAVEISEPKPMEVSICIP